MPRPPHPAPPNAHLSPDGRFWWDGREWVPNVTDAPVLASPPPPLAPTGPVMRRSTPAAYPRAASGPADPVAYGTGVTVINPGVLALTEWRSARVTATGMIVIGGILGILGAFLAWASVSAGPLTLSVSGVGAGDGWITFSAGCVVLGAGMLLARASLLARILAILGGLAMACVGLYDFAQVNNKIAGNFANTQLFSASAGIGLYATIVGGVLALVGAWVSWRSTQ